MPSEEISWSAQLLARSPKPPLLDRICRFLLPWRRVFSIKELADFEDSVREAKEKEGKALTVIKAQGKEKDIEEALSQYRDQHNREEDRKRGADSRLTTVVGLASLAVTLAAVVLAQTIDGNQLRFKGDLFTYIVGTLLAAAGLYMMLQLVFSVRAATNGLQVRSYSEIAPHDELPCCSEPERRARMISTLEEYSKCLASHDLQTARKMVQLQIAYQALRNFLGGVLVFALLLMAQKVLIAK